MHLSRRLAVAFAAIVTGMLVLVPGIASAAPSNGYYQQIATALRSKPVYVDAQASPSITQAQAQQLDSQIAATGKPIYLVLVDNNQAHAAASSPSDFLAGLHAALGNGTAEVIGLSTSKGFYANGYNEPSAVANGAGSDAKQAVDQFKGSGPYAVYSNWISSVSSIKVSSGSGPSTLPQTNSAASAKQGLPGWVILLIVLGSIVALIVIILMIVSWRRRVNNRTSQENSRRRLNRRVDSLNTSLLEMTAQVTLHPEAQSDHDQAMQDVQSAIQAISDGDLADAERYLNSADRHQVRAQSFINGVDPDARATRPSYRYDDDGAPTAPRTSGSSRYGSSSSGRPSAGSTTVVNNTVYTPQSSPMGGYQHYYGGGYYNGMYFGPGYYTDPFWTWEGILMTDMLLDESRERAYDEGRRDERDDRRDDDQQVSSGSTGGDSWGSTDGGWNTSDIPAGTADGGGWGGGDTTSSTSSSDWSSGSTDTGNSGGDSWGSSGGDSGWGSSDNSSGGSDNSGW